MNVCQICFLSAFGQDISKGKYVCQRIKTMDIKKKNMYARESSQWTLRKENMYARESSQWTDFSGKFQFVCNFSLLLVSGRALNSTAKIFKQKQSCVFSVYNGMKSGQCNVHGIKSYKHHKKNSGLISPTYRIIIYCSLYWREGRD